MVQFTQRDKDLSQGIYEDMAEAVARAVARREATVAAVHLAVFQHRFGTDITAHATQDAAEAALAAIARRECARDPELRQRVIDRFGAWPAQDMQADSLAGLYELWPALVEGESMWTVECDVELEPVDRRATCDGCDGGPPTEEA
jgi:hypothetical protein